MALLAIMAYNCIFNININEINNILRSVNNVDTVDDEPLQIFQTEYIMIFVTE